MARFPDTPATPDTLYFCGSTTKAMLAAALGIVIHDPAQTKLDSSLEEPLSWNTPLKSIIGDDFVLDDKYITENLSIEDSLSHRTGFQGADLFYGPYIGSKPREVTKRLRYLGPPNQPFRTAVQYNNFMFSAAGDALEVLTGKPCGEVIRDLLWKPIGMDRTFWHMQDVIDAPHIDKNKHMSRGYYWVADSKGQDSSSTKGFWVPTHYANFAGVAPAGAVISSVLDYAKWIQALLDASTPNKEGEPPSKPISSKLFTELTSARIAQTLPLPRQSHLGTSSWGLGWQIVPNLPGPRHPMMHHAGGLMGYSTMLYLLPNDSFGAVTLGNTQLTAHLVGGIICQELMSRKLGLKSPGREEDLRDFDMLMEAQLVALRHAVEVPTDEEPISEDYTTMFETSKPVLGKDIKPEQFIHSSDTSIKSTLQDLAGMYENPAFGSFRVTFAPAPATDSPSTRGENKLSDDPNIYLTHRFLRRDQSAVKTKDLIRATTHSLKIQPVGERVWTSRHLLHPRVLTPEDNFTPPSDKSTVIWFDQESFDVHGDVTKDVVPGLPSGVDGEDGDGSGKCRKETCYESTMWTRFGAAFMRGVNSDGVEMVKMGMSLGNASAYSDASLAKGWEGKKVWFTKKAEGDGK